MFSSLHLLPEKKRWAYIQLTVFSTCLSYALIIESKLYTLETVLQPMRVAQEFNKHCFHSSFQLFSCVQNVDTGQHFVE
jgi:hypothetical protein